MNDMTSVITPKSDQLNADDLITGPRTITITEVTIRPGTEQPVSIFFEGDGGKPYKPCKSMAKVLVHVWDKYANLYIGRSVTLYRDPKVKWAGMEIGGIRISHMSHIERDMMIPLTVTKGKWAVYKVRPLAMGKPKTEPQNPTAENQKPRDEITDSDTPPRDELREKADWMVKSLSACESEEKWATLETSAPRLLKMLDDAGRDDLKAMVVDAMAFHGERFAQTADVQA